MVRNGDTATVSGNITAQNDVENEAYINWVRYRLEYRLDGVWYELQTGDIAGSSTIPPGGTETWPYEITFSVIDGAQSYRLVALVQLENHPDGPHIFLARASFNVESPLGPKHIGAPLSPRQ